MINCAEIATIEEILALHFGQWLKNLRIEKNLTQKDIANVLNVSLSSVSRWEKGMNLMPVLKLVVLARVFNCDFDLPCLTRIYREVKNA